MKRTSAIKALLAVPLAALFVACSSGEQATSSADGESKQVSVTGFLDSMPSVPLHAAQEQGIFSKHGLSVELVEQPKNLTGTQAVKATGSDVGMISPITLGQGYQAGEKYAFFCGAQPHLVTSLLAPADSNLPSTASGATWQDILKSLDGKRVGIQTPVGSGLHKYFDAVLKDLGVSDVTYVNIGVSPGTARAVLQKKSVDVAQGGVPLTQQLVAEKVAKQLLYMPDGPAEYKNGYGNGFVASPDWVRKNGDTAKAFCDAITETMNFLSDPKESAAVDKLLKDRYKVNSATAKDVRGTFKSSFSTELPKDVIGATFDRLVELQVLESEPEPSFESLVVTPNV